jgi:hypothetical protein
MLAGCCLALASSAMASGITVLRVAAQEGTEPKFVPGPQGSVIGMCIDIMRAIERIAPGLRFEGHQQWMPLVRVLYEVSIGQQDAACGLQRTVERLPLYHFLDQELFIVNYVLVARADETAIINSWDDVRKLVRKPCCSLTAASRRRAFWSSWAACRLMAAPPVPRSTCKS